MRLLHTQPCRECPWRKTSARGWLGGNPPEVYPDAVMNNEVPVCHMVDFGPHDDRSAMCAGALATAANACVLPYKEAGGKEARDRVGLRDDCFRHPADFYKHHTGREYVPWVMRFFSRLAD